MNLDIFLISFLNAPTSLFSLFLSIGILRFSQIIIMILSKSSVECKCNDISIILSIIYSVFYMFFVGSYFGMGIGKNLVVIFCIIIGCFLGLYKKLFTSSLVFLFIYIGSLFSKGNGKIYTVLIGFILGIYISEKISKKINTISNNKFIKFFV